MQQTLNEAKQPTKNNPNDYSKHAALEIVYA